MRTHPSVRGVRFLLVSVMCLCVFAGRSLAVNFTSLPPNPPLIPGPAPGEILYEQRFEVGTTCTAAGWTAVDVTAQTANYFHVDNYVGLLGFAPIAGAKSLWCGARGPLCGFAMLPGYGNNWNQAWCTKNCITVAGPLNVSFDAIFDSEPGYDFTTLEYTTDCTGACGWTVLDGGPTVWDGILTFILPGFPGFGFVAAYPGLSSPVKVRLHFQSDKDWSDEDGIYPTNGAAHFDNLTVEGLALEDFEGEAVGAATSNDWTACTPPGFGNYMGLFPGSSVVQTDPNTKDLTCLWAAIVGSSETYACGGYPAFPSVPKGNCRGQYLSNEIWSPDIPTGGMGAKVYLTFSVYRDLPLVNLVFYTWHMRTITACPGPWKDHGFLYYGGGKDWFIHQESVGDLLDLVNGTGFNIALGAVDMCGVWCGVYGTGQCHSQAPLFDHVVLWRTPNSPQWAIRDIDQFQDNFAANGTLAGTVRADMAQDIRLGTNPAVVPGDTAVVTVADGESGIADDLVNGGKKVYLYVAVWPQGQAGKAGAALSQNPARFPFAGSQVIGGTTWYCIRLDRCVVNGSPVADRFCVGLNDNLFTPGDTVCFFYCAENTAGVRSYAYGSDLGTTGDDVYEAAANPSEFTCLPAGGWKRGGDILYVNGMDGRGAQPLFDTAFQQLYLLDRVDRYDVRGPSSAVSNGLSSRVQSIANQLIGCYQKIIWDCGDLEITPGDGSGGLHKTDDYGLINTFLDNLALPGGVYICGDDVAEQLNGYTSASAVTFKSTYLTYTLTTGNQAPTFGIAPIGRGTAGHCFNGDTFYIFGGSPVINDFDVMTPTGASQMEVTYGTNTGSNGAVTSKVTNNSNGVDVGVMMSGFSFIYLQDDDNDGILDRADHLHDILIWLGNAPPQPTGTGRPATNSLAQNYPNPFNPQTTIAFSLKARGRASLKVYDVAGQLVRTLAGETLAAGPHTRVWDGHDNAGQPVSSGVYFYRFVTNSFSQTRKMVLLK